jgi:methionyl-tRNA formyltransferase
MGSAAFAVPSLEALIKSGHDVILVVTQCDKPSGRGLKIHRCPVADYASSKNIPLFQPPKLKSADVCSHFSDLKMDLVVVVAYGKLIPSEILCLPKFECINVHASLLPKYRGAAPINWAIVNGEEKTGVTTMKVSEKMDAGDILLQEEVKIGPAETAADLHDRLAAAGSRLLIQTIEGLENKTIKPRPQDDSMATYAPMLKKEDGLIDWKKSAVEIFNLIRGMQPWPAAYTHLGAKMLKIYEARASGEKSGELPGTVVKSNGDLAVATGEGTLYLKDVQLEGKKRMTIDAFLRGHKIKTGEILSTKFKT